MSSESAGDGEHLLGGAAAHAGVSFAGDFRGVLQIIIIRTGQTICTMVIQCGGEGLRRRGLSFGPDKVS